MLCRIPYGRVFNGAEAENLNKLLFNAEDFDTNPNRHIDQRHYLRGGQRHINMEVKMATGYGLKPPSTLKSSFTQFWALIRSTKQTRRYSIHNHKKADAAYYVVYSHDYMKPLYGGRKQWYVTVWLISVKDEDRWMIFKTNSGVLGWLRDDIERPPPQAPVGTVPLRSPRRNPPRRLF
jgi:hypothetical protein